MRNLHAFALKFFLSLLLVGANIYSSSAQAVAKEVFGSAVDHINCETIRFIHREAGRAEVANNMDCLSFESIYKSVPADESKTTGALCKSINDFKNKFKADKPLDEQLNTVIAFANGKINAKKRKGNVEDFKASLEKIKKDALDEANGAANATGAKNTATGTASTEAGKKPEQTTASDTGQAIAAPVAESGSAKTGHKTDWLGLLSLLVALGALGLAYMAYSKVKKVDAGGSVYKDNSGANSINSSALDNAMKEIKRLESMIIASREETDKKIGEMQPAKGNSSNSTSALVEEAPRAQFSSTYIHVPEEIVPEQETVKSNDGEEEEEEEEEEQENEMEKDQDIVTPIIDQTAVELTSVETAPVEDIAKPEVETYTEPVHEPVAEQQPEATVTDLFAAPTAEAPVYTEPVAELIPVENQKTEIKTEEPFMPEKEYEDGEAVPFYKYASLPDAEGYFSNLSFTDDPVKDSVYEIEMYEDVPDKAFFSLLPNPEVIRRAIQNPEMYLKPCCSYSDDPSGKRTIILAEEGMLRKEDNKWMVYEKAKINFE